MLVHWSGEAPYKVDRFWDAAAGVDMIRVAYPEFVVKPSRVAQVRMKVGGTQVAGELVQDVTNIALQNLNDKIGRIKGKAIARAVAKYLTSKGLQAAGDKVEGKNAAAGGLMKLGGLIFGAASVIAEEADKRSWLLLPSAINVAQATVPPGELNIQLEFLDAHAAS